MDAHDERPVSRLTRRQLLQKGSLALGAAAALPAIVAACGGEGETSANTVATTEGEATGATPETGVAAETGAEAAGQPVRGGRLVVGMPIPGTDNLDPQNFVASGDKVRAFNVTERLAMINPDGGVKFHLAESAEPIASDATSWRVVLKSGITHTNGKDFTAADVLSSWNRLAETPLAPAVTGFVDLKNSKVVDDQTLEFALLSPVGDFPRFMAQEPLGIFPEGQTAWESPADLVGTGPYTIAEWTPGERYLMVRNDSYWEDGKPYLDEVEIINLARDDDQAGALLAGQIDGTSGLPEAQIRLLEDNPAAKLIVTPKIYNPTWYMRLDSGAFKDVRVRQAFKLAVDRQQCVDIEFGGRGGPGNDLWGALFPSYPDDLPQREYDPEQAQSLLREAGQEGIQVELVCSNYTDGATAFAQQAKAAGINITVKPVPAEDIYNTDLYYLKVPFGETLWTGSFEETAPQALVSDAFYNETAWKSSQWDKDFYRAFGTVDEETRLSIYSDLQEQVWDEGGYIVWGLADLVNATLPEINGVVPWGPVSWWNGLRFEDIWRSS